MPKTIATCYYAVNSIPPIPPFSNVLLNAPDMDNKEIRRQNLLLLKGEGTLEDLASKTDSDPAHLSQIKNGTRKMGDEVARRFEKKLRKNRGWMDMPHTEAREPKGRYLSLGPDVQTRVPLISWVQAGKFEEAEDVYRVGDAEDWYPMPKKAGPSCYCLRVEGDSMTAPFGKSYPAGSVVFVDPDQRSPANGARVIAKLEGSDEVTFKVFVQESGRTFLRPLNQQYPPIYEPFKVLGTVIGKWEDD